VGGTEKSRKQRATPRVNIKKERTSLGGGGGEGTTVPAGQLEKKKTNKRHEQDSGRYIKEAATLGKPNK